MHTHAKTKRTAPPPKLTPTANGQIAPELFIYDTLNVIEFESLKPGEDVDGMVIDAYCTLLTKKFIQIQKELKNHMNNQNNNHNNSERNNEQNKQIEELTLLNQSL